MCDRIAKGEDLQTILSASNEPEEAGSTLNEEAEEEFEDCEDDEGESKSLEASVNSENALEKPLQVDQNAKLKQRCSAYGKLKSKRLLVKVNKNKSGRIIKKSLGNFWRCVSITFSDFQ